MGAWWMCSTTAHRRGARAAYRCVRSTAESAPPPHTSGRAERPAVLEVGRGAARHRTDPPRRALQPRLRPSPAGGGGVGAAARPPGGRGGASHRSQTVVFSFGRARTSGFKLAMIVSNSTHNGRSGVVRVRKCQCSITVSRCSSLRIHLPEHLLEWYQEIPNSLI